MSMNDNNSFDVKYSPQTLQDVVFADPGNEVELQRYVARETLMPIIFYGPYGTGKTTLAQLMPAAVCGVEPLKAIQYHPDVLLFSPADGQSVNQRNKRIERALTYRPAVLAVRVVIFDELDVMGSGMVSCVKSALDRGRENALFIATTNNLEKLDGGHISRSNCLHIRPAPLDRWRPRVEKILKAEDVPVPYDDVLEDMLKVSKGDHRQFLSELQRHTEDVRQVAAE